MEICEICYENENNQKLFCKHKLCKKCFAKVDKCPFCRREIINLKTILKPLIKEYDSLYDVEYDVDARLNRTFAYTIFYEDRLYYNAFYKMKLSLVEVNKELYQPIVIDGYRYQTSGEYVFENPPMVSMVG